MSDYDPVTKSLNPDSQEPLVDGQQAAAAQSRQPHGQQGQPQHWQQGQPQHGQQGQPPYVAQPYVPVVGVQVATPIMVGGPVYVPLGYLPDDGCFAQQSVCWGIAAMILGFLFGSIIGLAFGIACFCAAQRMEVLRVAGDRNSYAMSRKWFHVWLLVTCITSVVTAVLSCILIFATNIFVYRASYSCDPC